jgi:hypothetical protein
MTTVGAMQRAAETPMCCIFPLPLFPPAPLSLPCLFLLGHLHSSLFITAFTFVGFPYSGFCPVNKVVVVEVKNFYEYILVDNIPTPWRIFVWFLIYYKRYVDIDGSEKNFEDEQVN